MNREIERRNRVVSIFPSGSACLRWITALLMEMDEAWLVGKTHLTLGEEVPPQY